jgi:hypothetical protein
MQWGDDKMTGKVALKLTASAIALAAFGFAGTAMAGTPIANPWATDGAQVGVNIEVGALGEVWSAMGTAQIRNSVAPPTLTITNAGGTIPAAGIANDTVYHYANVNYQVSVDISGNIPDWTRFHVLWGVANRGSYNSVFAGLAGQTNVSAATVVTYRRDGGGYIGNQPGTPVVVQTGIPSTAANSTLVDYAVDAINGLPPVTAATPITLTYTIAQP